MKGGGAAARLLPACAFPFAVERVAVKKLCDGALLPDPRTLQHSDDEVCVRQNGKGRDQRSRLLFIQWVAILSVG